MYRYIFFSFVLTLFANEVQGQPGSKPSLDTTVFHRWKTLAGVEASPDGNFIAYFIDPLPNVRKNSQLIIRKTHADISYSWMTSAQTVSFSNNNKYAVFGPSTDTLKIVRLEDASEKLLTGVNRFQLIGNSLCYFLNGKPTQLHIRDIESGKERLFSQVTGYSVAGDRALLLSRQNPNEASLIYYDPSKDKEPLVLHSAKIINGLVKDIGTGLWLFSAKDAQGNETLYKWQQGMTSPVKLFKNIEATKRFEAAVPSYISPDKKWLVVMQVPKPEVAEPNPVGLTVWNYRDPAFKFRRAATDTLKEAFSAFEIASGRIVNLTDGHGFLNGISGNFALITRESGAGSWVEKSWNRTAQEQLILKNLKTGNELELPARRHTSLSEDGRFVLSYNLIDQQYWLMETGGGKARCLTCGVSADWTTGKWVSEPGSVDNRFTELQWLANGHLILFSRYDIYEFDPAGKKEPLCLTGKLGAKKEIIFSMFSKQKDRWLLNAQEVSTRSNGFFELRQGKMPVQLMMEAARFDNALIGFNRQAIKGWLFYRAAHGGAPNLIYTTDLVNFKKISDHHPEAAYNWLVTEIHNYNHPNGKKLQGILFRPENMDPTKKYPLIFNYYQRLQDILHDFPNPTHTVGDLNIPFMVSQGYLVFVPDIQNEINKSGQSALECILAAARHLKIFSYVDSTRMALAGHSFGGFETAYAIAHSSDFVAAYAGAAPTDMLVNSSIDPGVFRQFAITTILWDNPRPHSDNSPLLAANRMTTPLLMLGNSKDFLFPQPLELFMALRRLGRPVWMLQYAGQDHTVHGAAETDLTIRMWQFFDHYLKDKPMPYWMSRPGSLDSGLEKGSYKLKGILTEQAQEHADSLQSHSPLRIIKE